MFLWRNLSPSVLAAAAAALTRGRPDAAAASPDHDRRPQVPPATTGQAGERPTSGQAGERPVSSGAAAPGIAKN